MCSRLSRIGRLTLGRLIAEPYNLVVALFFMRARFTRCAVHESHELFVSQTFIVQFFQLFQRKFQTLVIKIAPRLRNAALAWLRAGLASTGAACPTSPPSCSNGHGRLLSGTFQPSTARRSRSSELPGMPRPTISIRAIGAKAFAEWSAKSAKNDPAATEARWQHYRTSPPTKVGFGTLVYLARQHSPGCRAHPRR